MRAKAFVVSVVMAGVIIPASSAAASAQPMNDGQSEAGTQKTSKPVLISLLAGSKNALAADDWLLKDARDKPAAKSSEQPVAHTVQNGETLTSIAKQHDTKWLRLWQKNMEVAHPDELTTGDKLTIPLEGEELKPRELPAPPVIIEQPEITSAPQAAAQQQPRNTTRRTSEAQSMAIGSSAGNRYTPGYCTWYIKNKRPDLPNNLGNADTWVSRAAAQGLATGSTPRVGAVGQRGMHVAYVESVNADGTILVSEMNHKGLWVISSRTVPGDYFTYVY